MEGGTNEQSNLKSIYHLNYINYDLEDEESQFKEVIACKLSYLKCILTCFFSLLLFPILLMYWFDSVKYFLLFKNCFLDEATYLAIRDKDESLELIKILKIIDDNNQIKFRKIIYRYLPYKIIDHVVTPIRFKYNIPCTELIDKFNKRNLKFISKIKHQTMQLKYVFSSQHL